MKNLTGRTPQLHISQQIIYKKKKNQQKIKEKNRKFWSKKHFYYSFHRTDISES